MEVFLYLKKFLNFLLIIQVFSTVWKWGVPMQASVKLEWQKVKKQLPWTYMEKSWAFLDSNNNPWNHTR